MRYTLIWLETNARYPVPDEGEAVLGREAAHADIVLPVQTVSARHARLFWKGGVLWLEDLGSTNGTFLNGERLTEPRRVAAGDEIGLGRQVVLKLEAVAAPQPTMAETPSEPEAPAQLQGRVASETLFGAQAERLAQALQAPPPWLVVSLPHQTPKSYLLSQPVVTLGSAADNAVVLPPELPPYYARLRRTREGSYRWETLAAEPLPTLRGNITARSFDLLPGDEVVIPLRGGLSLRLLYHLPKGEALEAAEGEILFGDRDRITIGRAPDNDVVLDSPVVSRHHAVVRREKDGTFRLRDLNTPNGTFVNGRRVKSAVLKPGDQVRIGPYRFVVGGRGLAQYAETGGVWLAAVGLNRWVRRDLNILQDVSLVIEPRELVVIVGQSGSGKTTLLNALSGFEPASQGEVVVNGVNIYHNFDAVRHHIGYVPQQDIIHKELTVWEALDYAARLRMPPDTTAEERRARINAVLEDLDLAHRRDVPIGKLSGGQQKRVSIGVELLTRPGLFFLDEPTSGLDPGTETAFMHLLRRLADQGCTIVLVTHTTKNVELADKVVFMARGGYLAWYGPPREALDYFDRFRTAEARAQGAMTFDDIYALLDDPELGTAEDWAKRFREHEAYSRYITQPLRAKQTLPSLDEDARKSLMLSAGMKTHTAERRHAKKPLAAGGAPPLRQMFVLFSRNIRVLMRDRFGMVLMMVVAPLVASLDFLLAALLGREPFDFQRGSFSTVMVTLFSLTVYAVMVGSLSQMREIIKERDIYRRERLVNLRLWPYVTSKFGVAVLMAFYQAAWYVALHYLAFKMPGGWQEAALIYLTLTLTALGGMMLGLFSSALAPTANAAPLIVILFMVPQIVLSGVQIPLPNAVSAVSNTRWGFEGLMSITGVGSDPISDACWQLPLEARASMTVDDKTALCRCMGLNLLNPKSCNFPGLGKYALPQANQPPPVAPVKPGDPPPEPKLPPPPPKPSQPADSVAMAQYFNAVQAYQAKVKAIQEAYKAEMAEYQARVNIYSAQMYAYQQALVRWQMARAMALGPAEGLITRALEDYGWTFVDKRRPALYYRKVLATWEGQGIIIAVLFLAVWGVLWLRDRL